MEKFYSIKLGKVEFDDSLACLGQQLEKILTCIYEIDVDLKWLVFDVEGGTRGSENPLFSGELEMKIENTPQLIKMVHEVIQFESGVFIGIKKNTTNCYKIDKLPTTEEQEGMQIIDSEIEIRAFDYLCFEIYCKSKIMYERIKKLCQ